MPLLVESPGSDRDVGLSDPEAARRLAAVGPNTLPPPDRPALWTRLAAELREPMSLLLIAAAAVSGFGLGEVVDAVAILAIVIINSVISLLQQGRAERALEALQTLEAPQATVVRDGRRQLLPAAGLVPGDLVLVQAGDRVPADLVLTDATGVEVDEAVLTGESLPAAKRAGGATDPGTAIAERDGVLHAGTLITRGVGRGEVARTGTTTELGAIAVALQAGSREPTPLQVQLGGLSRRLAAAAVAVAGAMFALVLLVLGEVGSEQAFLTAVALAVASVPEGLAAVTTVALALGVARMARRGAIVRRLPAVETLGATDVLVIDKTGTITQNRMEMAGLIGSDGNEVVPAAAPDELVEAIRPVLWLCNDSTLDPPTGDPTEQALLVGDVDAVRRCRLDHPRLAVAPFTSERRRMSTVHQFDGHPVLLVKGAPEVVLERCGQAGVDGRAVPLDRAAADRLLAVADRRAAMGQRVLALARRTLAEVPGDVEAAETGLSLLGLVALRDPPRPSASSSVAAVQACGIRLLVATGDHPATAGAIAQEVGIDVRSMTTGSEMREHGMPEDPTSTVLYARVDPDQKLQLVETLKARGHTVAMTGDGVNDAPALRRADIGVALGATGSDVAREAADLVITDDDLATIVTAVEEGRGIYDNIRKVVEYLVTGNLAEIVVVVSVLVLLPSFGVPLSPLQLLWINLLTDGLPALALGVDPVDPGLMRRPPRSAHVRLLGVRHLRRLLVRGLVLAGGAIGAFLLAFGPLDLSEVEARTVLFSAVVCGQILYAFVVHLGPEGPRRRRGNPWLWAAAATALALQLLIVTFPPARQVFDTTPLSGPAIAAVAMGGIVGPLLLLAARGIGGRRRSAPPQLG